MIGVMSSEAARNVLPFLRSTAGIEADIRSIAENDEHVAISQSLLAQMEERQFTDLQLIRALRRSRLMGAQPGKGIGTSNCTVTDGIRGTRESVLVRVTVANRKLLVLEIEWIVQ